MAARKTERLVNLTILLLSSRFFVPRDQIRRTVQGYENLSDEAFMRMFERDKNDLRALGVPIETGSNDPFFGDEPGYRISRRDFELPPIEFTPEETTVLGLAATVWQQASAAEDTTHALAKLRAAGVDLDPERLTALAPRLSAREEGFEPLWQAVIDRQVVRFGYRGSSEVRTVEPWRLALRSNSWYLIGYDRTRQAPRVFKLSRITDPPKPIGAPDAFVAPEEGSIAGHASILHLPDWELHAVLAVRGDRAPTLRRRGQPCDSPIPLPTGFRAFRVPFGSGSAVAEIASHGADVIVVEPPELRSQVVGHLRAVLRAHGGADQTGELP